MKRNVKNCQAANATVMELGDGDTSPERLKAYLSAGILLPVEVAFVEKLLRNCH